jgi:6,7-dimethyl-8-ribityllumazine synthase
MPRYIEGNLTAPPGRFALCVSRFNGLITEELLKGALDALTRHGVSDEAIDVFRCPGAFDLPGLVRQVSRGGAYVGVVCLGAVIRGGTPHFDYVAGEVAKGVGQIALESECAVTFGVLTCDTIDQAVERAGTKAGNKGADAAVACLEMVNLYARMASIENKGRLKAMEGKKK